MGTSLELTWVPISVIRIGFNACPDQVFLVNAYADSDPVIWWPKIVNNSDETKNSEINKYNGFTVCLGLEGRTIFKREHPALQNITPDPALFVGGWQDANKNIFFYSFLAYYHFLKVNIIYISLKR